jgi:hypothetical protein
LVDIAETNAHRSSAAISSVWFVIGDLTALTNGLSPVSMTSRRICLHFAFFFTSFPAFFLAVLLAGSPGGLPTPIERVSQFGCLHFGQRTGLPGTRLTQA